MYWSSFSIMHGLVISNDRQDFHCCYNAFEIINSKHQQDPKLSQDAVHLNSRLSSFYRLKLQKPMKGWLCKRDLQLKMCRKGNAPIWVFKPTPRYRPCVQVFLGFDQGESGESVYVLLSRYRCKWYCYNVYLICICIYLCVFLIGLVFELLQNPQQKFQICKESNKPHTKLNLYIANQRLWILSSVCLNFTGVDF